MQMLVNPLDAEFAELERKRADIAAREAELAQQKLETEIEQRALERIRAKLAPYFNELAEAQPQPAPSGESPEARQ